MEIYKSDGIAIHGDKTPKGIEYLEYGNVGDPLIIYLHGVGEVGKSPYALLSQSPVSAGWDKSIGTWGGYAGWRFPDFFTKGIRVIAPILKSGAWTPAYIDSFLDEINISNLTCLMGWSWGGAGAATYLNQIIPKYNFKCGALMCMSGAGSGTNVKCQIKMIHAANDTTTSIANSDNFWAGVPQQFKISYDKPTSGGHYVWANFLEPSTGIYEWIKSFSIPSVPVQPDIINPSLSFNLATGELTINGTHKIQTNKI